MSNSKTRSKLGESKYIKEVDINFFDKSSACATIDDYAATNEYTNEIGAIMIGGHFIRKAFNDPINSDFNLFLKKIFTSDYLWYSSAYENLNEIPKILHDNIKFHLFMKSDILMGLAFIIIFCLRFMNSTPNMPFIFQRFKNDCLVSNSLPKLEALLNGIVRPIIKVPRFVIL
jgi:hypothetical protein